MNNLTNQHANRPPGEGSPPRAEYKKLGEGEFQIFMEEMIRECIPANLGISKLSTGIIPAIVLKQPLKNKNSYAGCDTQISWTIPVQHGKINDVFLNINFKELDIIKIHIPNIHEVVEWFELLTKTNGQMILNDTTSNNVKAIHITGVPLQIGFITRVGE